MSFTTMSLSAHINRLYIGQEEVTSQTVEISLCGRVWHLSRLPPASLPQLQVRSAPQVLQPSAVSTYIAFSFSFLLTNCNVTSCFTKALYPLDTRVYVSQLSSTLGRFLNLLAGRLISIKQVIP